MELPQTTKNKSLGLFLVLALYALIFFLISPRGEFAVNDDWIFYRQVEHFLSGNFRLSALIDPSFIAQGFVATIWARVFGLSFFSLRILTFLFTILATIGLNKILRLLAVDKKIKTAVCLIFILNPLVLHLSMTFMTDMYFLAFFIWSIYFFLKYVRNFKYSALLAALLLATLATLVRQIGILLPIAYVIAKIQQNRASVKTLFDKDVVISLIFALLGFFTAAFWPKYSSNHIRILINWPTYVWLFIIVYLAFFVMPILRPAKIKGFLSLLIIGAISYFIFIYDMFPIGNIMYVEGLNLKNNYKFILNLFDNALVKITLSVVFAYLVLQAIKLLKDILFQKRGFIHNFLFSIFALNIGVLLVSSDLYDRYILPATVVLLILGAVNLSKHKPNYLYMFGTTAFIILVGLILQLDFVNKTREKWIQATAIQNSYHIASQIYVDGIYNKYQRAKKLNNYDGLISKDSPEDYVCYVQFYNIENEKSPIYKTLSIIEGFTERFVPLPRIFNSTKKQGVPNVKKHLGELIYSKEIFSPLYNAVGQKTYISSWCDSTFITKFNGTESR